MRIDHEAKEIVCSVGDLVHESTYRRIGVERGDGFRRMWLGQDIHQRRAEQRAADDPFYRPEVSVTHKLTLGSWSVTVQGRIDGLSIDRETKRIVIEEVKSVHFDLELESLFRSDKLQRHIYQLLLYSYYISLREEYADYELHPQLVLIDLMSGDTRTIDATYESAKIAATLEASLVALVAQIEAATALRSAKRAFAEALTFPYDQPRPFQDEIVSAVARAIWQKEMLLVSAPTGIGKTIAALYPAVRQSLKLGKKLFFLTSKTLQQEAAVKALSMLNDGSFRVLRIRSKEKMCAHTEMICHEDFCPYAARYSDKVQRSGLITNIATTMSYYDPDIVFEMSKSTEVCPFEVSLELIEQADVVVCDYNYIFDPYVGLKTYQRDNDYGDCVLIVDEAHNLIDRGRGYYSPEIDEKMLDSVRTHLRSRNCYIEGWEELLGLLRDHFSALASEMDQEAGQMQALCNPDRELFLEQRVEWERVVMSYISWKIENRVVEEDDPLVDFYFRLVKFTNLLEEKGEEFAHIIERAADGLRLKIFCKDPSRFLGRIFESAYASIALSATLEPFDFFRKTLGVPRNRGSELSLPSPFPKENRKIVIVADVETTYKQRANHYERIGENVAAISGAADGNFLALFPSYSFLREVADRMPAVRKNIMVQRSDMTDYERNAILQILRDKPREGNLILAVSGGMYAEGVDYSGDMLSGVIVIGPALPAVSFEQELLKRYYDEQYGMGFEFAYLIPGMHRVVQSAGRVIRSETDIGVIALLCRRFTQESYNQYFPSDWFEESPRELVTRRAADEVREFFESKRRGEMMIFGEPVPLPAITVKRKTARS